MTYFSIRKFSLGLLFIAVLGGGALWFVRTAQGVNRTWDGGGVDGTCGGAGTANNWSCAANWSGDTAPTASDVAIFDGTSTKNATINSAINVAGISINAGYTGTITQSSTNSISVGSSNYSQAAGTFTGGSGTFTVTGTFALSGGIFTSTSGTLAIGSALSSSTTIFTVSGGTFTHNSGTVSFPITHVSCASMTQTVDVVTSLTLYNIAMSSGNSCTTWDTVTTASGDTIIAANDFTLDGVVLEGTWEVQGNVTIAGVTNGGTGTLTMTGTGSKTYTYTSGVGPHLRINNAGLTVSANTGTTSLSTQYFSLLAGTFIAPTGTFTIGSGVSSTNTLFTVSGGTFSHNSGTMAFDPTHGCVTPTYTLDVLTTLTLYNIILNSSGGCSQYNIFTPGAGDTIIAANDFTFTGGILQGTWEVQNNVVIGSSTAGGTGTLTMTGTGSKTYTYTSGVGPHLRINNAGLTVSANTGTTSLSTQYFSLLAGTFIAPTGTLSIGSGVSSSTDTIFAISGGAFNHNNGTIAFVPDHPNCAAGTYTIDVATSLTLYNIIFNTPGGCSAYSILTTASGDTIIAANDFTVDGATFLDGTWEVQGDVTIGASVSGGAGTFTFTGGNTQVYTDQGGNEPDGDIVINKTANSVMLASNADWNASSQDLTITSGALLQASTYAVATGAVTVGASGNWINSGTGDVTLGGAVSNSGLIDFRSGNSCGGTDTIALHSSVDSTQRAWSGAGTVVMRDIEVKDQGGSASITAYSSTSTSGNGGNWTFNATCPFPIQPSMGLSTGKMNLQSGKMNLQ